MAAAACCCAAQPLRPTQRGRRKPCARAVTPAGSGSQQARLQLLPPLTFSYDARHLDTHELADLLQQVACFAPGQSFHVASPAAACSINPRRLEGALQRSLLCVAAYSSEQHLPQWQHLASRGLAPQQAPPRLEPVPWPVLPSRRQQRQVLVGFARAVGDAALVATVHDVAVMPELQRLGLGRQLLARLLRQLNTLGIIDVGLLAPDSSQGFFSACSFGRDSEGSTTMTLSHRGVEQREDLSVEGLSLRPRQPGRGGLQLDALDARYKSVQ